MHINYSYHATCSLDVAHAHLCLLFNQCCLCLFAICNSCDSISVILKNRGYVAYPQYFYHKTYFLGKVLQTTNSLVLEFLGHMW